MEENRFTKNNYISLVNNKIATLNINQNEEKPLENITLNFLRASSCFKGREGILNEIYKLFETKQIVVIHGGPGIGKTETARHFAENNSEYFSGNLIWIYAEAPQNIQKCFEELAATLELKTSDVSLVFSKFKKSRCLFVFDNVENMVAIRALLPSSQIHPAVSVLITSQFSEWDVTVGKVPIKALKPEDAVDILREKLGDTFNKKPQKIWIKIVEQLECIPLSVQIVASILHEKFRTISIENFDFEAFINELMDGSFINSKFLISEQNQYNKTVLSSIYYTINCLKMKDSLNLLTFIAYMDADCIYRNDLLSFVPNDKLQEALNTLKDYSLIQFDLQEDYYKMKVHRTIQLVLRKYDLNELNGKILKEILKIIVENRPFVHMCSVFKYVNKEEFQEKLLEIYNETKKNQTLIRSYFHHLALHHCDKILRIVLPKFKAEFYKTNKYNRILNYMLFLAIYKKNTDTRTIEVLIDFGAKITYSPEINWTNGFHKASLWFSRELLDRLLETNDSKNIINSKDKDDKTILHLLVLNSNKNEDNISKTIECMDSLISKWKADISIRDNKLNNILHTALLNEDISLELIKYFLEKSNIKNLINSQNEDEETPLHFIFKHNYSNSDLFDFFSYFINECEADPTIQNKDGWNTLFFVCCYGTSETIDFILKSINCREMINIQDKCGDVAFTQLFNNKRIVEREIIKLMALFIENKMDFQIRNKENQTLAEIAKEKNLMNLFDNLSKYENAEMDIPAK